MGESASPVDLLVIGGGPGGYTAALHAAGLGRRVTLVDDAGTSGIGGTCLNVGCIPSKLLIETADRLAAARALLGDRLPVPDLDAWQANRGSVVRSLGDGVLGELKSAGVEILAGRVRFTGRDRVAVSAEDDTGARFLGFRHALIATGSTPRRLDHIPTDGERVLDSTGALALRELPASMVVLGAGYIGVELATAFAKLGAEVTLVEQRSRVLPELPAMFGRPVDKRLADLGVTRLLDAGEVELTDAGVRVTTPKGHTDVMAEKVVVVAGRVPNTAELGLSAARIPRDDAGRIPVRPDRIVEGTNVAAVGDVTAGPMLAHKASAEAVVAAEALCGRRVAFEPAAIPLVVYSDPEIAGAGLDLDDAKAAGIKAEAVTVPLRANARAATMDARLGFAQLVVDTDADAVIGVHLAGPHASELIAEGVLAIEMGAAPGDLAGSVHAHPTLSESLHAAARRYCAGRT